jgi:hypothetical protein
VGHPGPGISAFSMGNLNESVHAMLWTLRGVLDMNIDSKTHNLFLTTADFGPVHPLTKENPEAERKPIHGTFRVLIYGCYAFSQLRKPKL